MQAGRDYDRAILDVFAGRDPGFVVWQPRLEFWFQVNSKRGTLPPHLQTDDIRLVYDYCHASIRYFGRSGLGHRYRHVEITSEWLDAKRRRDTYHTPLGSLSEVHHYDAWNLSSHLTEYKLKGPEDFAILEFMLQDEEWFWDQRAYEEEVTRFGAYGCPQFYFRRSPIQGLFIEHMGLSNTIYMLHDYPDIVAHYVEVQTAADEALYALLCTCPTPVLNLGENIDAYMDPPPIWRQHLLPYYVRRTEQLRQAGKYTHIHIDGAMKPLLPYLQECSWDGIEAATPLPQGDVTIEEIKQGLGDLVLLDGIPALYFLPSFSQEELMDCVRRLVELFYPRLILGISDEIPPDGDIERVRAVGELVQELV
ncbi:MAG: hypothetical protein H5T69_19130 [Chloroflexi bacterium]|nr:hypothetical protein [Chloroflexota bacterium]